MKRGRNILILVFVLLQASLIVSAIFLQKHPVVGDDHPVFFFLFYYFVILASIAFAWIVLRKMNRLKRTEKRLRSYTTLIDHTPIFIRNMRNEIISWNKGMEKLYGWNEKEVLGKICHQLFATEFPAALHEIDNAVLVNNLWQGELKHTLRDGTVIDVSSHWSVIRGEDGTPTLIMETITDLRELKLKEDQVASLSEVLNKSNDAIYTVDVHRKIKTWNKGAEKLFGYTEAEALGQDSNELLKIFFSNKDMRVIMTELSEKDHWMGEVRRRTKLGKELYVQTSASPVRSPDGIITGYIIAGHDITESVRLREQVTHLANLVDYSNDAISSTSLDGQIISWNKGAVALYGYTVEEAMGKNIRMIIPPEMINEQQSIIGKIKSGAILEQLDTQRLRKDGSRVHVSLSISAVKNSEGELIAVSGSARDISERMATQEKIIESEQNLKAVFENSSEEFLLIDTNGVIKAFNQLAQKNIVRNLGQQVALGKTIFDIVEPSRHAFLKTLFAKVMNGQTMQFERVFNYEDGSICWMNFVYNPVRGQDNTVTGVCITGLDVTAKKIAEQQREFDRNNLYALINNTNDLMWSVSRDFKLITSNQAFDEMTRRMSGKSLMKGGDIFALQFGEEMQQRYRSYYERAFAGEAFTETEYTFTSFEYWAENSFYPIYEGNQVVGTACFSKDISARKKAEQLLEKSFSEQQLLADRMYSIINTLPANIALLNDTGIIIDVNESWKSFANNNSFQGSQYGIGQNYIAVAEKSFGGDKNDGVYVANGIRNVIVKKEKQFVFEYPCHSATEQRWFKMVVTPFQNKEHAGAVVMHLDISEIRLLHQQQLQNKLEEQKKLNRSVLQAQEKERNELGRDLHDNICQMLAVLRMKLDFSIGNQSLDSSFIRECVHFLDDAIVETHNIWHRMIIPRFAEGSLEDALQNLSKTYTHQDRKVTLEYSDTDDKKIPVPVKEALYRIAQENLNNIHKYAAASDVKVALTSGTGIVRLMIEDNGVGFDSAKKRTGVGITNIISRAESFNGSARITSALGKGSQLLVEIPIRDVAS